MKILMLADVYHPDTIGGAGRVAAELANGLHKLNCNIRVITRATSRAPQLRESIDGIEFFRYPINPSKPFSFIQTARKEIENCLSVALENFRPDIIDLHQPLSAYSSFSLQSLKKIPSVYTFHSSWADELAVRGGIHALFSPIARLVEKQVLKNADKIVVLSAYSEKRVLSINSKCRIKIIPGGVDLEKFPLKKNCALHSPPVILTVRNLVRRMGLDHLINAAIILKKKGVKFELRIGGTGPLEKKLRSAAEPLEDSCKFLGYIPEEKISSVYRDADLFVLPTIAIEGFGLVILESFASGTPVIGTDIGAIPELLELQGSEYVVESSDAPALAKKIELFFERKDKIAPSQLRNIAEEFPWSERAKKILALYHELSLKK